MTNLDLSDIGRHPAAFWAQKLPIPVFVKFAFACGKLETREGLVDFVDGDAILTGVEGECWPITRKKFFETYQVSPPTEEGQTGQYVKRPRKVVCLQVNNPLKIQLASNRGALRVQPGDYLVQYQPGDLAVVSESIFQKSYQIVNIHKSDSVP